MPAKSEFKTGFWLGLGLLVAFSVLSVLQWMVYRATKRGGSGG